MFITEYIVSMVAPHMCVGCGCEGRLLCPDCTKKYLPQPIARCYRCHVSANMSETCKRCRRQSKLWRVRAAARYEGCAKDLVWRLKFGRAKAGGTEIGILLAPLVSDYARVERVILTHVPTATSRVRQRGYDQAALIAKAAARGAGLPYAPLLLRVGQQRQVGGSREKRRAQIKRAFRIRNPHQVRNAHVILIDDVVTTGATLEAAAAILKAAGAKKVEALVFAQA